METPPSTLGRPDFRPLYQQVREWLLTRIASGEWRPAEALPSEQALASELRVSQGTIRKALDSLVAENLVQRQQGKGTFVVEHTQESSHFRFFRLARTDGERVLPASKEAKIVLREAPEDVRKHLQMERGHRVFVITRFRYVDDKPAMYERIYIAEDLFPGLASNKPLPNALYALYQSHYGVSIAMAREQIRADGATAFDAEHASVTEGTPILEVMRVAIDIKERPVEYRISRYYDPAHVYAVDLQ